MHQQFTREQLLDMFKHNVAKTMQSMMDAMLAAVVPEGEDLEEYRKRHKVFITTDKLRNGVEYTIVVDGSSVGSLLWDDGYLEATLDFRPYMGTSPR